MVGGKDAWDAAGAAGDARPPARGDKANNPGGGGGEHADLKAGRAPTLQHEPWRLAKQQAGGIVQEQVRTWMKSLGADLPGVMPPAELVWTDAAPVGFRNYDGKVRHYTLPGLIARTWSVKRGVKGQAGTAYVLTAGDGEKFRAGMVGATPAGGMVELCGLGSDRDGVLIIASSLADAMVLHAATGRPAWAWVGRDKPGKMGDVRLYSSGWGSPGSGAGRLRGLVLAGPLTAAEDGGAAELAIAANELVQHELQVLCVQPAGSMLPGLVEGGEGEGHRAIEGTTVAWAAAWMAMVERLGVKGAQAAISAQIDAGLDQRALAAKRAPEKADGGGHGSQGRHSGMANLGGGGSGGADGGEDGGGGRDGGDVGEGGGGGAWGAPLPWRPLKWQTQVEAVSETELVMPQDERQIAREYLMARCIMRGERQFRIRYWGGRFYAYDAACWRAIGAGPEESRDIVAGEVQHWLGAYCKRRKRKSKDDTSCEPFSPSGEFCKAIAAAIAHEVRIRDVSDLPSWLAATIEDDGEPCFGEAGRLWGGAHQRAGEGRGDPRGLIIGADGVIDLGESARDGKVKRRPLTADLFSTDALPYTLPIDEVNALLSGVDQHDVMVKCAPWFWHFVCGLTEVVGGAPDEIDEDELRFIGELLGDTVDYDRSIEKINMVIGQRRAGKDTLADAIVAMLGKKNVGSMQSDTFTDRFGLYSLIGKRCAMMREVELGKNDAAGKVVEYSKLLSGQSEIGIRDLYGPKVDVRMGVRMWWFSNGMPTHLRDASGAFAGRFMFLRLKRSHYGQEDDRVKKMVPTEGRGILAWAIYHAIKLRQKPVRKIEEPASSRAMREQFELATAAESKFIEDCLELVKGPAGPAEGWEDFADVYDAYRWWHAKGGTTPTGRSKLSADLAVLVPGFATKRSGTGNRQVKVSGLRLKVDVKREAEQWAVDHKG